LGGDEFAILLVLTGAQAAAILARELADCISLPYTIDQLTIEISASIGVAAYPDSGTNSGELLHRADEAMYKAKSGRKRRQTVRRRELSAQAV
jgi:diguanylate cyclase (GGDEF)-like protein